MLSPPNTERIFGMPDQIAFAAFSGDYNPIHVDAIYARRTQAGAPVVHGIHILLWALEVLLQFDLRPQTIRSFRGRFRAPLLVGDHAEIRVQRKNDCTGTAKIYVGEITCSTIELRDSFLLPLLRAVPLSDGSAIEIDVPDNPAEVMFDSAMSLSGRLSLSTVSRATKYPGVETAIG